MSAQDASRSIGQVMHGQHGVEMHHRPGRRQFHGDHLGGLPSPQQGRGEQLACHRRGALAHADHYRAVAEHVHVAAFDTMTWGSRPTSDATLKVMTLPFFSIRISAGRPGRFCPAGPAFLSA
jgi:hypothetical protein